MAKLQEIMERYGLSMERIRGIKEERTVAAPFYDYFQRTADFILEAADFAAASEDGSLKNMTLEELQDLNHRLYADIEGPAYEKSYANPAVAAELLGEDYGQLLSFIYAEVRGMIPWAAEGRYEDLTTAAELFIHVYNEFEDGVPRAKQLKEDIYLHVSDYCDVFIPYRIREQLDPTLSFAADIILNEDLFDPRYLYFFGEYISENEIGTARYLAGLPEEEIEAMARTFTEGYRIGFVNAGIDLSRKKTVNIRYSLGFERVVRSAIRQFEDMGLKSIIYRQAVHSINRRVQGNPGYLGGSANRQYEYDHREDSALYLDRKLVDRKLSVLHEAYEEYRDLAAVHAGPAVLETFGETPFMPLSKEEAPHLDAKQQALSVMYNSKSGSLTNKYIKGDERSFTIISWPVPAIGDQYEEIFEETVKINNLDYRLYQGIQQKLIEALDQGEYVHVKGAGENRTDIRVQLWRPRDPEHESIFENCVADVNIPVGEVFTSPKLSGTNGTLHVSEVYLNGLRYVDLAMEFRDGRVEDYTCANFESEEKNRKYLRDNVLFNHDRLPLGEFAIGTNTTAYMAARKYGIGGLLPILIAEKTGPHFAVGDTCFSWCEDNPTFNPDGKRIIAKDNECSILRKEDVSKAYFNCHTDITIPFDELDFIKAVRPDGSEIPIIKGGRFVLPGTEELNRPLDEGC